MTAPGQEPDEVTTAKPGSGKDDADAPDLKAIGDHHMPEDLRRSERAKAAQREDAPGTGDEHTGDAEQAGVNDG